MQKNIGVIAAMLAASQMGKARGKKHAPEAAPVYHGPNGGRKGSAHTGRRITFGHCAWVKGSHGKHPAVPLPGELRSKSKKPNREHWRRRNAEKRERRVLRAAGVLP